MSLDWRQFLVDLPPGRVNQVEIAPIEIDEHTARFSRMRAVFQNGRGVVDEGTYTGLYRHGYLWMSDTPDEIQDHYPAYLEAQARGGRVLISGLGLGMIVKALLKLPQVEHIDVVELDPDVVALVGPHYASERCTIHLGNAHEITWPEGTRWTVAWHDIWPDISQANIQDMEKLLAKYADSVDWQDAWSLDLAKEMT